MEWDNEHKEKVEAHLNKFWSNQCLLYAGNYKREMGHVKLVLYSKPLNLVSNQ